MSKGLGELEVLVVLAALRLGEDAYAVTIVDEIKEHTGRKVQRATVYVTLQRLENKGLLTTWLGKPRAERGGKGRRYVRVESAGVDAVRSVRRSLESMWRGLGPTLEGAS